MFVGLQNQSTLSGSRRREQHKAKRRLFESLVAIPAREDFELADTSQFCSKVLGESVERVAALPEFSGLVTVHRILAVLKPAPATLVRPRVQHVAGSKLAVHASLIRR